MEHIFTSTRDAVVVQTRQGKLRGFYYDDVFNFWGVRYARARRFRMPVPPESWEGVRTAMAYGHVSPLLEDPIPDFELTVPHRFWPEGEDCLNLNIATPTLDTNAKKPVMVWFHGGGFSDGSAIAHIAFEGDNMARNHDVVMVCVNHRLNAFGFLDLSMYGDEYKNSGNVGIADLVAALQWVQENIQAFGGDPNNVTIFGQSGGGGKVNALGQSPAADGLFQKAIVMSGVFDGGKMVEFPEADPKEVVQEILKELNLREDELDKLETVDFRLFIMAVNRMRRTFGKRGQVVSWGPHKNDWYLGDPLRDGFRDHFKTIPMMIGSTLGEFYNSETAKNKWKMTEAEQEQVVLNKYGEESGRKLLDMFRRAYPGKNVAYAAFLDNLVRPGTVKYARKKSEGNHAPIYVYLLASVYQFETGMPAWHNSDIPYVFGNAERIQYCCATKNWEALAELMPAAFSAFAHKGDPNLDGLPDWAPADNEKAPTMIFDETIEAKTDFDTEMLAFVDSLTPPVSFGIHEPKKDEQEGHQWTY